MGAPTTSPRPTARRIEVDYEPTYFKAIWYYAHSIAGRPLIPLHVSVWEWDTIDNIERKWFTNQMQARYGKDWDRDDD